MIIESTFPITLRVPITPIKCDLPRRYNIPLLITNAERNPTKRRPIQLFYTNFIVNGLIWG